MKMLIPTHRKVSHVAAGIDLVFCDFSSRVSKKQSDRLRSAYGLTRLLCFGRGEATSSRHDRLLLGKQIVKDILSPLSELEALVRIEDHGLHECLGLLTTRFPNGFDGQAPFCR